MNEEPTGPRRASHYRQGVRQQKQEILNVRAEALRRRGPAERALARTASILASPLFFLAEFIFHLGWMILNAGWLPGITPWDPYPFSFLLGLASAQALFIGLLILMHTQQETLISEVREETDLQVVLHSERETTKLLQMMEEIHRKLDIPLIPHEDDLTEMAQPLDPEHLRSATEQDLNESENESA